jgi:DNA-binding NtrC family response regulator
MATQASRVVAEPAAAGTSANGDAIAQRILVAEDNGDARETLKRFLEKALHAPVDVAADGKQALASLLAQPYSVLITDIKMPHLDGMQLIEEIQTRKLPVSVIVTTGHGSIDDAVRAIQFGAYDFLTKPPDPDRLCHTVRRALRERVLLDEVNALRAKLHERHAFKSMLSRNPRMHDIFELVSHVAETTSTVLIEGETGTGKEQVARGIHEASSAARPGAFVAVNCAAVPETLLESELFGHEKGSFTGAANQRKGRFEQAHGGTLFLDEIGDVPASMQVKLLRVLQERRFERVGGAETIEVDVRVVAASNQSLPRLVKEGKFREDLFYRLNVIKIDLPPLRDRKEDIPILAAHFAHKYARGNQGAMQIAPEAMEKLLEYAWPGNIRQLENAIERGCVTARDGCIRPENLALDPSDGDRGNRGASIDLSRPFSEQLAALTARFEERFLRRALRKTRGHVGRTARIMGLSRRSVTSKIALYKIDRAEFNSDSATP